MDVARALVDVAPIVIDVLLVLHDVRIRRWRSRGGSLRPRAHGHKSGKCNCHEASLKSVYPSHGERPPFLRFKIRIELSVHCKKPGDAGKVAQVWKDFRI